MVISYCDNILKDIVFKVIDFNNGGMKIQSDLLKGGSYLINLKSMEGDTDYFDGQYDSIGVITEGASKLRNFITVEMKSTGNVLNDIKELLLNGQYGLFYLKHKDRYTLFTVGYKIDGIPSIYPNSVLPIGDGVNFFLDKYDDRTYFQVGRLFFYK